jgi:hypothetical protein
MEDDTVCVVKMIPESGKRCYASIIFNGATTVRTIAIEIEEAAHARVVEVYDQGVGFTVQYSEQVGEGGLVPFKKKLMEMYPNAIMLNGDAFDEIVEAQAEVADKLKIIETKH